MNKIALNGEFEIEELMQIIAEKSAEYFTGKRGNIGSPKDAIRFIESAIGARPSEAFAVLFLDSKNSVLEFEIMFTGTIDGASIHPREVVRSCLKHNAAAVIFSHNHPSGSTEPSKADIAITRRLKGALELIDVRVLDHIIVGKPGYSVSLADRGSI